MGKDKNIKQVGRVSKQIAEDWYIEEHANKKINLKLSLYQHISKHAEQYISVDSYSYTMDHIVDVINTPDYVFFNYCEPNGKIALEYYKKLIENVVVIVHVKNKRELKIDSVYPVTETKIKNRKIKESKIKNKILINKFKHKDKKEFIIK